MQQRANERKIRSAKLEADALRAAGQDDTEARLKLGRAQASQRQLLTDNTWLKRRPERERAYGEDGKPVNVRALEKRPSGNTDHALKRMAERNVTQEQMDNARANPLHVSEVKIDSDGRPSQTYIGNSATVVINPETGDIITTNPTSKRRRRKYGGPDEQRPAEAPQSPGD